MPQVRSIDGTFRALRGRVGDFIFRTRDNKIFVFYKPTKGRPISDPFPVHFREIAKVLNLEIVSKTSKSEHK